MPVVRDSHLNEVKTNALENVDSYWPSIELLTIRLAKPLALLCWHFTPLHAQMGDLPAYSKKHSFNPSVYLLEAKLQHGHSFMRQQSRAKFWKRCQISHFGDSVLTTKLASVLICFGIHEMYLNQLQFDTCYIKHRVPADNAKKYFWEIFKFANASTNLWVTHRSSNETNRGSDAMTVSSPFPLNPMLLHINISGGCYCAP